MASLRRSSSITTSTAHSTVYKGKVTRSWQQLPPEIIRLIATHHLLDISATTYCPQTWEARENWHSRMVYTVLRDANDVEKLMRICPAWHAALETLLFWNQACSVIDPYDTLAHHAIIHPRLNAHVNASTAPPLPFRISPYRHFRNMTGCSCYVCRINSPQHSLGLASAKRHVTTPFLGTILVCREHRRNSFCGLCLREAPPLEIENDYNLVLCVENEDDESWPGVDATCRSCRNEWLWRRASTNPRDREAVGGPKWNSPDWETRQSIEAFIEMGEGTISDVITLAQEKHWLRCNTKLPDMLSQALAASRYATREESLGARGGYLSDEELSDDGEDEDDPELMSLTEDAGGVRDLAINDWARNRILDGHWFSPADQWYGNTVPNRSTVVPAVHPCPWTREPMGNRGHHEATIGSDGDEVHPRLSTVRAEVPPTFQLCEQAYIAYQKQIRLILLPAMANVVRQLIVECKADGTDPALRATRMDPETVVANLRDDVVWYNGIDWLERRANRRRELLSTSSENREEDRKDKDDGDDSSASSKSDGSHTTSPVLSTSTLRTTPSPPPSVGKKDEERVPLRSDIRSPTIPTSPVLHPPTLLHPIPYVPVTVSHLPQYSLEAIKMVWREACAPLYHCRCKICERALAIQSNIAPKQAGVHPRDSVPIRSTEKLIQIKIDAAIPADVEGEDEIEEYEESDSEEEDDEVEELNSQTRQRRADEATIPRSLKRGSEELDDDPIRDPGHHSSVARVGTPPKRAKIEEQAPFGSTPPSPERLRKRNSEELHDRVDGEVTTKKPKVDMDSNEESSEGVPPSPTSINGTEPTPSAEEDEDKRLPVEKRPRTLSYSTKPRGLHSHSQLHGLASKHPPASLGVREADLDQLYSFEAEIDIS